MGELNIDKALISLCNSLSQYNAGNVRVREWEATFQRFDQQFPVTDDLTEEQAAYLRERREKYRGLVEAAANDNLRRRAAWVPMNVAGRSGYSYRHGEKANLEMRKNEEYNEKVDRFLENTARRLEAMIPLDVILDRIKKNGLGHGEVIQSDDPHAIEKLEAKLEYHQSKQDRMKAENAYYRKHKTMKGAPGISAIDAIKRDAAIVRSLSLTPYPSCTLTNNNSIIKSTQARINKLKHRQAQGNTEKEAADGIRIVENTDIDRLQLFFPDIPPEDTRALLKSRGFRWSPKNKAWQRQLTNNARYALERFLKEVGASAAEEQPPQVLPEAAAGND